MTVIWWQDLTTPEDYVVCGSCEELVPEAEFEKHSCPDPETLAEIREEWPVHRPEATDAPIPGRHWYAGCEPADYSEERGYHGPGPRVDPATGICEGCGESACRFCGRENCPDHPAAP